MPVIQPANPQPINLVQSTQELSQSLQAIQPDSSQLTRTITFALIATALVGIFIYHYIKKQEALS